jgi:hypothetical protein
MRSQIYYPFQRAKTGEFGAMKALSDWTKSLVCPGFDFPVAHDAKAFEDLQAGVARDLAQTWGTANELFLDISRYDPDSLMPDGFSYVSRLFETARLVRLKAIPVVAPILDRYGATGVYFKSVAAIAAKDGRGIAIRIPYDDLKQSDKLNGIVDDIQSVVSVGDHQCDVILDFGPLDKLSATRKQAAELVQQAISSAASAFNRRHFRVLVACGSSIPRTIGKVPDGEPVVIPNAEFQAWSQSMNSVSCRHVRFGDYAARYALQTDKASGANPPARIHLSTPDAHLLYVGDGPKYRELAENVVATPEFASQNGAWGRNAVRDAALGRAVGNAATWVARDTHMHVETMAHAALERLKEVGIDATPSISKSGLFDQAELSL